jgi:hypothetical protein
MTRRKNILGREMGYYKCLEVKTTWKLPGRIRRNEWLKCSKVRMMM